MERFMLPKKMPKLLKNNIVNQIKISYTRYDILIGAGGENRTLIVCLEGRHISRYTTPAYLYYTSGDYDMEV